MNFCFSIWPNAIAAVSVVVVAVVIVVVVFALPVIVVVAVERCLAATCPAVFAVDLPNASVHHVC